MALAALLPVCSALHRDGGLPEYSCALMLDDVEMYHYDSNSHRIISRIPSVQEAVGKQRIRIYVERLKANHMIVKENMLYMMKRRNISSGVHYGQAVYGCEVREDGTRVGQITIAFDGKDFLSFDKNDLRWISAVPEAQTLRRKLDNDRDRNQVWKQDLEYDCPTWIEEFYPAELCVTVLPSPGRPDVSVSYRRDVGGRALLSCLVTGFYPRPIEVTWTRDGNTVHEVESSGVLPNHDHTFQTVKQMELETGSVGEQGFSCLVEHSSLQGVLEVCRAGGYTGGGVLDELGSVDSEVGETREEGIGIVKVGGDKHMDKGFGCVGWSKLTLRLCTGSVSLRQRAVRLRRS
uniref:Class I histocompatibility antigen, F10 alpha chain-like n=1 Tax=Callorhinchus milii TaxID=7868 RepID=A0A4W3GI80_CALMI